MKRSRFTEEQIIGLKKEEAGATVNVFRKHGISAASVAKYKAKYRGMDESIPAK